MASPHTPAIWLKVASCFLTSNVRNDKIVSTYSDNGSNQYTNIKVTILFWWVSEMGGTIGDTWPGRCVAQADNVTTCISLGYELTANRFVVRNGHFGSTARLWMYGLFFLFYFLLFRVAHFGPILVLYAYLFLWGHHSTFYPHNPQEREKISLFQKK